MTEQFSHNSRVLRTQLTSSTRLDAQVGWENLLHHEPTVSVVIPTLNEAPSLPWVLEQLPEWVSQVVLVDGLSTDHTELIARVHRTDLTVIHQTRPGKGAAVRAGFAAATGDIVVMLDADASTDPREMGRFVAALRDGAEFVKGSRRLKGGGSDDFSLLRRAGNLAFVVIVNLLFRTRFSDLCYGYCAFWRSHLDALDLTADGFEIETELVLRAVRAGLDIREVPSFERPRQYGKSNLKAFADGRRVLRTILSERRGRSSPPQAGGAVTRLVPVELPVPGSPGWVPAGNDRRLVDRRAAAPGAYTGLDRRRRDRRSPPADTVVVYRAVTEPPASVPGRTLRWRLRAPRKAGDLTGPALDQVAAVGSEPGVP